MKNITKTIITAVLLLLTVGLFAQEDSTKAIVKDANGISTGLTKAELEKFKKDYKQGLIERGKTVRNESDYDKLVDFCLKHRINLNALDELMKIRGSKTIDDYLNDFDLGFGYLSSYCTYWGEITAFSDDNNFFYVTVREIIHGEEYLKAHYGELPKVIKVGNYIGSDCGSAYDKSIIGIELLSRHFDEIKIGSDGVHYFGGSLGNFIINKRGSSAAKNNEQRYIDGTGIKLEDYLHNYKKSAELNDEKNFYNRRYSVKGDK